MQLRAEHSLLFSTHDGRKGRRTVKQPRRAANHQSTILRGLDECGNRLPLLVCEHTLQERGMLLHLVLHGRGNADHVAAWHLQQGVVLRQHGDCGLEGRDGFQQIFLLT